MQAPSMRRTRPRRLLLTVATLVLALLVAQTGSVAERPGAAVVDTTGATPGSRVGNVPTPTAARPNGAARPTGDRAIRVRGNRHSVVDLDPAALVSALVATPHVAEGDRRSSGPSAVATIELPSPDGGTQRFAVVAAPVMAPALAARYPTITTYRGVGVDDPDASVRLSLSPDGLHAQVLSPHGHWYVDPYSTTDDTTHISYLGDDLLDGHEFVEIGWIDADGVHRAAEGQDALSHDPAHDPAHDVTHDEHTVATSAGRARAAPGVVQLRTYRLAVSTTAEYSAFHSPQGDRAEVMAAVVAAVTRVTGIYEDELAISLQLVDGTDGLIFFDAATDPFTNDDAGEMLGENQRTIDDAIGTANYDVGHVFSTGGGGLARIASVGVDGIKAQGVTGSLNPIGDAFWVDYVAHELGHQFGANHTFSGTAGSCGGGNARSATAVEPGSGSTIMAYAGICGDDDLARRSDPYFHTVSHAEIGAHVARVGRGGAVTNTTNRPPTVSVVGGTRFVIPVNTPFVLTASGQDPDGDTLSYTWEQTDAGVLRRLTQTGATAGGALFRSRPPTHDPSRWFPALTSVDAGLTSALATCPALPEGRACWSELLPSTSRTMNFRVTARDDADDAGGRATASVVVGAVESRPFAITSHREPLVLAPGATVTVTWDVAGTDTGLVDTPTVDILVSVDSGASFPTALAVDVPNDGAHRVRLPASPARAVRLMVRGHDNIFFDTTDADISLAVAPGAPRQVVGTARDRRAAVSWRAPSSDGFSAITSYVVRSSPGGLTCSTTARRRCVVRGLTPGVDYTFTVRAFSAVGPGPSSAPSPVLRAITVPGRTRAVAVVAGSRRLTVGWRAPVADGGSPIIGYVARAAPGGRSCATDGRRSCTITDLEPGTAYTVTVRARNAVGAGPRSRPSPPTTVR